MATEYEVCYQSVTAILCTLGGYPACSRWMSRAELADHLRDWHPDENQDPEHYWLIEADARFNRGPR